MTKKYLILCLIPLSANSLVSAAYSQ